jgi:hypothetical protein
MVACGPPGTAGEQRERAGHCDPQVLRAAADETAATLTTWTPARGQPPDLRAAARGVWQACPGLPEGLRRYIDVGVDHLAPGDAADPVEAILPGHRTVHGVNVYDAPEVVRVMATICPDHQAIVAAMATLPGDTQALSMYDGCHFATIGLVAREEVKDIAGDVAGRFGHVLYRWLVDDGAPPEVARTLARASIAAMDDSPRLATSPQRLPAATSGQALHVLSSVSAALDGVSFNEQQIVVLTHGRLADADQSSGLIGALFDQFTEEIERVRKLTTGTSTPPTLELVVDPQLPWETVRALAITARRAGYERLGAVVLVPSPLHPFAYLALVDFAGGPSTVTIEVRAAGLTVRCGASASTPAPGELAAAVARCGDKARIAAARDVTWQQVIDVVDALAGKATIVELADLEAGPVAPPPGQAAP